MSRSRSTSSTGTLMAVSSKVETALDAAGARVTSVFTGVIDESVIRDLHRQLLDAIGLRGSSQTRLLWIMNAKEVIRFDASIKERLAEVLELGARNFRNELVLIISNNDSLGTFRAFMMSACMGRMKLNLADSPEEADRIIAAL